MSRARKTPTGTRFFLGPWSRRQGNDFGKDQTKNDVVLPQ